MKINFNPAVCFGSNLIEDRLNGVQTGQSAVSSLPNNGTDEYLKKESQKLDQDRINDVIQKQGMSFEETLKDKDWEKIYYPDGNFVHVRQKGVYDGKEFEIKPDGKVTQVGTWAQPKVILEPNIMTEEIFRKIKNGEDLSVVKEVSSKDAKLEKPKKSLWLRSKEAVANVWKFFSVTGTMAYATGKGLLEGAVAGAGVFASAWLLGGAKSMIKNEKTFKQVLQTPFKTAGKAGTIFGVTAGLVMLGINLVKGKLKANQNSAVIEHKMDVAHVND